VYLCVQCGASLGDVARFCSACGATVQESAGAEASDPLIGRTVGGRYLLQEVVGVGGMGRVYKAEQSTLGRTVAVKVIHPHLLSDEQTVARFYQEARASSRLNHPNSVSIIDFGRTDDGILYLAMEFLSGKDLALVMHEQGPLAVDRAAKILINTLDALGEAHDLGIVHRDLKPENIILRPLRSGDDLVKVVDFGLATILGGDSSITKPGLVCGTPDYMSPEQGRGDAVDGRGDLYALGVVLFELLTGRLPYIDDTPTRVVLRHMNDPIPDPRETSPNRAIPDVLAQVTMKALAKEPEDRFLNARQMQKALRRAIEGIGAGRAGHSKCPNCGTAASAKQNFCGECGQRLTGREPSVPSTRSLRPSFYPPLGSQRPFVGREAELAFMFKLRRQSAQGALWVHLSGEAGVGKTRFLTELAEKAAVEGDVVVGAGAHATGAPVPYSAIRRVLCELLEVDESELARMASQGDTIGVPLAAAGIAEIVKPSGLLGAGGRARTGAVAEALVHAIKDARGRSASGRVMVLIDDLPYCDGLTRQTLVELTRVLGSEPVLLVSAGDSGPVAEVADHIKLEGFAPEEAERFLRGSAELQLVSRLSEIRQVANGQLLPLHLEQLEALGVAASRDDDGIPRLADAIGQRTERLSVQAGRLLQAAAVLGWRVELDALRSVAQNDELEGLDELAGESLVQLDGSCLDIVHPFIAELVEASIPAEARKELHRRAYGVMTERRAAEEVRAAHAFHAGEPMTGLVLLEQMGDSAMERGDHSGAVLGYQRALELARRAALESGDIGLDQAISTFSRKLAEALARSGDPAGADGVLREALDLTGPKSPERAKMLLSLGRIAARRDRPRDAMRHFGRALELVADVDPAVESHLQVAIGRIRRIDGDAPHAANAYRRALDLFKQAGADATLSTRTRLELADALSAAGEHGAAARELELVEEEGLEHGAMSLVARAVGMLGSLDELAGRTAEAKRRYEKAASLAAAAGDAPGHRRWLSASKTLRASL
jgi:serine/threonine protein kinase/tetratricopeptide (TPR) repeat protein